ncbi:MAG: ATP-dependent endonuclease, partial [Thermoplasmata archaeon]|nr:ATP-dependent endonuclease [Thermoplasmata archaeon]
MKIKQVSIENYRSIKDVTVNLQNLTGLIGENNVGKTNILTALDLFFRGTTRGISENDFFRGRAEGEENAIRISVEFHKLTDREKKKFTKYLVDEGLTVRKSFWVGDDGKVNTRFQAKVLEPKQDFLKLSRFDEYKSDLTEIVKKEGLPDYFRADSGRVTQASYEEGVGRYISEHQDEIEWDEPTFSDSFYGWKEVAQSYMPEFFYVPAVRDISEESKVSGTTFFGQLVEAMVSTMVEKNPEVLDIEQHVERFGKLIARGEDEANDERLEEIKEFENQLTNILKESMPDTQVEIQFSPPSVRDFFHFGTTVYVDDGIRTVVDVKGHGLQRAMIFAIFRAYADFLRKRLGTEEGVDEPSFIFAIEEPELFLHPHSQRKLYEVLKQVSRKDQVMYCTHSPHIVDILDYPSVCIVCKPDVAEGTQTFQYLGELFEPGEKEELVTALKCGAAQSELFFAKKVILVEGPTEAVVFPMFADKLEADLDGMGVSIIDVGGKTNIPRFMKVLNAFRIRYLAMYDVDPGKENSEEQNRAIAEALDGEVGTKKAIDPDIG